MFFFIGIYQLLVFPFFQDNPLYFSFDTEMGAFGWLAEPSTFIYLVTFVVPITSILSNIGFCKMFEYWPIEIISIALLFEPFITEFIAIMLGQDHLPGIHTLVGILIIGVGLILATYGAKLKDLWFFSHAQEFECVSAAQHEEFLLRYQMPIIEKFGLVNYGCCETSTIK